VKGSGSASDRAAGAPSLATGWRGEITPLCVLIWLRLLGREATPDIDVRDRAQAKAIAEQVSAMQREFVELRIADRVRWYTNAVDRINLARTVVSAVAAAGGVVIASLTAINQKSSSGLSWQDYVVIALAVIVGIVGAIGPRIGRAQQVERYRRGGNRLRSEAWLFALGRGSYAEIEDVDEAFDVFIDRVDAIESDAIATESDITHET
jgi:hypothetical protein